MVRAEGLEPPHLTAPDPKSGVSANFTTRAGRKAGGKDFTLLCRFPEIQCKNGSLWP
jgi:hypothetical protein